MMTSLKKEKEEGCGGAFSLVHKLTNQQLVRMQDILVKKKKELSSSKIHENILLCNKHRSLQDARRVSLNH